VWVGKESNKPLLTVEQTSKREFVDLCHTDEIRRYVQTDLALDQIPCIAPKMATEKKVTTGDQVGQAIGGKSS